MSKITRMQRSYKYQPHLPFMPVNLPSHPWAKRLKYKYDTLPIVEVAPKQWTLEHSVTRLWFSHAAYFTEILSTWRHHLCYAPMSIENNANIRDYDLRRVFETEAKARGYFWFCRTLIFSMYAQYSFVCAGRKTWREDVEEFLKKGNYPIEKQWQDDVAEALCDFRYTKRAGVVVDVATTEIWHLLRRYHENGVPILMDVGHVTFHDRDQHPKLPTIFITDAQTKYDKYPTDWPMKSELILRVQNHLKKYFEDRLGDSTTRTISPLTVSRPLVEEAGSRIHQRCQTSSWVHPDTNQEVEFLQMADPQPVDSRTSSERIGWVEFFDGRRITN